MSSPRDPSSPAFPDEAALFDVAAPRRRWWQRRPRGGAEDEAVLERVRTPLRRSRRIVVASRKGGVGKTTTALMLGHTFAASRLDRVVAVDSDPDGGTLAQRVAELPGRDVGDLLAEVRDVRGYAALRRFTAHTPTGLEVLASPAEPDPDRTWHAAEYLRVVARLGGSYGIILLDTGTGVLEGVTAGMLEAADQLVLVVGGGADEARASASTLDWLEAQGSGALVRDAVVVLGGHRPIPGEVAGAKAAWFAERCRAVCEVPFDPHLALGAVVDPTQLQAATRRAYLDLAAAVADGFPLDPARTTSHPPS